MIKTPERFDIKFLDASRISKHTRCPAACLFRSLMGLRQTDANILPLDYGTVMHLVLPLMYSGDPKLAFAKFDLEWAKLPYGEEDAIRNTGISHIRINDFVASHSSTSCPYEILHFDFKSPSQLISDNEVPFLIDVGMDFPLAGRIDASVKWGASGATWAYDFKTSSELSDRLFDGFWMSSQALVYTIALSHITGKKVEGLIVEGMRMSKTRFETQIGFTFVHEYHIKHFLEELKYKVEDIQNANETGCWRQNFALCTSYPGFGFPSRQCDFKMICDCPNWEDGARFYKRCVPFDPLEVATK